MRRTAPVPRPCAARGIGAAIVIVLAATVGAIVGMTVPNGPGGSGVAWADEGLDVTSTTTYRLDSAAGVVRVVAEYRITNPLSDVRDGNIVRRPFFSGYTVPVAVGAENPAATTDGVPLAIESRLVPDETDIYLFDISLARNLFAKQSTTVVLTYDLSGFPPRSDNQSRVNGAYAFFEAFGLGDPGQVTVRVEIPTGWDFETFGEEPRRQAVDGATVLVTDDIAEPDRYALFVSARLDDALASTDVVVGDDQFSITHWPDDQEWADFVRTQLTDGVPELAELIGEPWPLSDRLVVLQTVTPYLYGYAGWFSVTDDEVEVGEDLDAEVVLHELSHAWFNSTTFSDRWVNEGFAQLYSNQAVGRLGGAAAEPESIDPAAPAALQLEDWDTPDFDDADDTTDDATEEYGYNAAWSVIDRVFDEIGEEAMSDVLVAAYGDVSPYPGDPATADEVEDDDPSAPERPVDRRRLLDLFERVGGSTTAADLFRDHVLSVSDTAALDDLTARAEAISVYDDLVDRGAGWAAPAGLRTAMTDWAFDDVDPIVTAAGEVLDALDALATATRELGVEIPTLFEADYERAVDVADLEAIAAEIDDRIDAVAVVTAAQGRLEQPREVALRVGLMGAELDPILADARASLESGEPDAARASTALLVRTLDDAPALGRSRILRASMAAAAVSLLLIALIVVVVRRRRSTRRRSLAVHHPVDPGLLAEVDPTRPAPFDPPFDPPSDSPSDPPPVVDRG